MNCLVLPLLMMLYCLMPGIQEHQIGKSVTLYYRPSKALFIQLLPLQYCMMSVALFHCHYHLWSLYDLKLSNTSNLIVTLFQLPGVIAKQRWCLLAQVTHLTLFVLFDWDGMYVIVTVFSENLLKFVHTPLW